MKKYILSIDQGTTGSRAFVFDPQGKVVASAYQEFKQYYPKPGWVEHDAEEIWASVDHVIRRAIKTAGIESSDVAAIGITNQRETTVVWNRKTGKPVYRAIVWQCRRTAEQCVSLQRHQARFRQITGLVVDAYFSATKLQWILDHVKGARAQVGKGQLAFGTVDSWLLWKLTGGQTHTTDFTNASRTMMFDINTRRWSTSLLKLLNIPASLLPNVLASGSVFGKTVNGIAGLNGDIPIASMIGDQQAALYGQGCTRAGTMKNTYGTGCFLLLNTGKTKITSTHGLLTTIAVDGKGQPVYALEGSVFIAGAVVQWLRDELKVIPDAMSTEKLIKAVSDTNGVYFVPALVGLGAPYWNPHARGAIVGLTRGANRQHVVRAALEAIAYQTRDIVDLMKKESGLRIRSLAVDGGACRNNFLMQFQADMLHADICRPHMVDTTAAGAAYLAGITIGYWNERQLAAMRVVEHIFHATMPLKEVQKKYTGWQEAVQMVLK